MKKVYFSLALLGVLFLQSCATFTMNSTPVAVNTIATASFADLKLERSDYEITGDVSGEAIISATYTATGFTIEDAAHTFKITYVYNAQQKSYMVQSSEGVLQSGYLSNDYGSGAATVYGPEDVARKMAVYRAINAAREQGADGLIEPVISTNLSSEATRHSRTYIFKTTVNAKAYRLKSDSQLGSKKK